MRFSTSAASTQEGHRVSKIMIVWLQLLQTDSKQSDITSDFSQIIHQYESTLLDHASRKHSRLQNVHSWDEVMQAAKLAQDKYLTDAKGGKGRLRRVFRWTGDHSSVLVQSVGLLPNDKYFSVLF